MTDSSPERPPEGVRPAADLLPQVHAELRRLLAEGQTSPGEEAAHG
jgi:hypothetical protein